MTAVGNGRYLLETRIAAGGMGEVWRGTDTSLGRTVAIKVLRSDVSDDEKFRQRFAAEAQYAASLHDPHIATVFDFGDDVDAATGRHSTYLVMEFVDGVPLSDAMSEPMEPQRAADLIGQAAQGLAAAHAAGIVHRDVKPANFIVRRDGRVKITDFGISRARGSASLTDTGTIMGTPHYLAPEVAEGREATPASDVYSLGVVLFEALTALKPFEGETPIAIALAHLRSDPRPLPETVPPALRSITESAMAREPMARPASAAAMGAALQTFLDEHDRAVRPVPADPAPTQVLPAGQAATAHRIEATGDTRWRAWLPLAVGIATVLLVVGVVYAVQSGDGAASRATGANQLGAQQRQPVRAKITPSTAADPTTVTVDPGDYVDQPAGDAEKQLKALGFDIHKRDVSGGEKGLVAAVRPSGEVPAGHQVTLSVYSGDPPPHDHGKPKHKPEED